MNEARRLGGALSNNEAVAVDQEIAPWSLSATHCLVTPKGKETGVRVCRRRGRYITEMVSSGAMLWSGPSVKYFIERFWP